jgi:hypothetical protein
MNWNLGFSFGAPWWLLGLLLLPVLAWTRNRIGREGAFIYSSLNLMKGITELSRSRAGTVLNNLRWIGLVLLILGMARPRVGGGLAPIKASGIDIAVAVDLSGSMAAEDFELRGERVNRLTMLRDVLRTFIDNRPADRIGLVAFAGDAFLLCPLTVDYAGFLMNLEALDTTAVPRGGTKRDVHPAGHAAAGAVGGMCYWLVPFPFDVAKSRIQTGTHGLPPGVTPTVAAVLRTTYGHEAALWERRWRLFFLATAGLFGAQQGQEWGVSHYRLKRP